MSLKFWSVSTTMRNPERLPEFLEVINEFDGFTFPSNSDKKKAFQRLVFIKKFQKKYYGFGNAQFTNPLPLKYKRWMDNAFKKNEDLSFEKAEEILESKKYTGGMDLRGRQDINVPKKFYCCWYNDWTDPKNITFEINKKFIELSKNSTLFHRHILLQSFQFPDPENKKYKKEAGYDIRPLTATLSLIKEVNRLSINNSQKPVGISMTEFEMFCITMINGNQIKERALKIIRFREDIKKINRRDRKNFIKERFAIENSSSYKFENASEYGDNVFRNFRLTNFLSEKRYGEYHFINLNNDYIDEIDKAIEFYGVYATIIETKEEQIKFFTDPNNSIILDKNTVIKEIERIINKYPKFKVIKLNEYSINKLLDIKENLLSEIRLKNMNQIRDNLVQNKKESLNEIIDIFKGDYNNFTPEGLEYEVSRAFMCLADISSKIKPNYSADKDGYPISHAKANYPDIECFLSDFNLICEVTKLTGRNQWYMESVPIQRHLNKFEDENPDSDNYCLFIAPRFHDDGLWAIWCSVKYGYLNQKKQKIIPLTISEFLNLIEYFKDKDNFEDLFKDTLNQCLNINKINNFKDWRDNIRKIVGKPK